MAHYIDAKKLKKIVEQAKQRALKGAEVDDDLYCDGRADAFGEVLLEIDSLQQEQPEVDIEEEYDNNCPICGCALDAAGCCSYCGNGRR